MTKKQPHRPEQQRSDGFSRRSFLSRAGVAGTVAATTPWWMAGRARANNDALLPTIVTIFLRGGMDGLALVSLPNDPFLNAARPNLKIQIPNARAWLDNRFALAPGAIHPSMASPIDMKVPYTDGHLTFVHGVGIKGNSRSHFEAMKHMEAGQSPGQLLLPTGWWGRHMQEFNPPVPVRGFSHGRIRPRSLAGAPKVQPIPDVSNMKFPGNATTAPVRRLGIDLAYQSTPRTMAKTAAGEYFGALDTLSNVTYTTVPGIYPNSPLGDALRHTAAIIKDPNVDLESVHVDLGSWDHHRAQGVNASPGTFFDMSRDLSYALGAFYQDLGKGNGVDNYLVLVMSEFGRRIAENSSVGTDHGYGGVMIAMGAGVSQGSYGGKVFAEFGPLSNNASRYPSPTFEDLTITLDTRDVLGEALVNRGGLPPSRLATVIPRAGWTPRNPGPGIIG